MNTSLKRSLPLAMAVAGALTLAACDRGEQRSAGQAVDETLAKVEQKSEAAADAARQAAEQAGEKVAAVARDAAITAEINAALARDPGLSALKVDVDTAGGRVVLRGSAPDAAARERATRLAADVKGVVAVENLMSVAAPSS